MGLFLNKKCSGMVLTGAFAVPAAMSLAQQGAVSAGAQSNVTGGAFNNFAGKVVKKLDLKFFKNNWFEILLTVELIVIFGLIGYGIFFKKKNVKNVIALDNSSKNNNINESEKDDFKKNDNFEKGGNLEENAGKVGEDNNEMGLKNGNKSIMVNGNVVNKNDFKEEVKEEVKEENNKEKENILINNKMVDKDDFSIFNEKNVNFDKKDNPIVQKEQGKIDYLVKINVSEIEEGTKEELKKLLEDFKIFLDEVKEKETNGDIFLDKGGRIFYVDKDKDTVGINANDKNEDSIKAKDKLLNLMIKKVERSKDIVVFKRISDIGLKKLLELAKSNGDISQISSCYEKIKDNFIFVKKIAEGKFEGGYIDEDGDFCTFNSLGVSEINDLFRGEEIENKEDNDMKDDNNFNLLNVD